MVWVALTRVIRPMQPPVHAPERGRAKSLVNSGGEAHV